MAVTAALITVRCACGQSWEVPPRADGTFPATARCAKKRDGCGRVVTLPRAAPGAPGTAALAPSAWEPPSKAPEPVLTGECCPDCGAALHTIGRGTRRVCVACGHAVTPAGVRAPYERGTAAGRQVRSQRERDLEALALAGRKGVILARLRAIADDERLHPESAPKVEWFAEQVRAAQTGARLDELAALLPEADIRRIRWWQGAPAIGAVAYDDEADDDTAEPSPPPQPQAAVSPAGHAPHRVIAAPPPPAPAAEPLSGVLARLGWRVNGSVRAPWCQVTDGGVDCERASRETLGEVRLCGEHYRQLTRYAVSA